MNSTQLKVFISIAVLFWFLLYSFSFSNDPVTQAQALAALTPFSAVCTMMAGLLFAFDHWLWKWSRINEFLAGNRRDISGTWKLTLHSNWKDPQTGEGVPPIEAYMRIYQTFFRLDMKQMTKESESFSTASNMACSPSGLCEVTVVYSNDPRSSVRHRSERHFGAFRIRVSGTPVQSIEGEYWTDRTTKGEMIFIERKSELFDNFKLARQAFGLSNHSNDPVDDNKNLKIKNG